MPEVATFLKPKKEISEYYSTTYGRFGQRADSKRNNKKYEEDDSVTPGVIGVEQFLPKSPYAKEVRAEIKYWGSLKHHQPSNMLVLGSQGKGKTLKLVIMAVDCQRAIDATPNAVQKVVSNILIKPLNELPPLGWEYQRDEEGGVDYGKPKLPIVRCDPEIIDDLANIPPHIYDLEIFIDELSILRNSHNWQSRISKDFNVILTQIRHFGCEIFAATQHGNEVQGATLKRFHVLARPELDLKANTLTVRYWDHTSTFLDTERKYADNSWVFDKPADWVRVIHNPKAAFGLYDTREIVIPKHWPQERKDNVVRAQIWQENYAASRGIRYNLRQDNDE